MRAPLPYEERMVDVFAAVSGRDLPWMLDDVELGCRASDAVDEENVFPWHAITRRSAEAALLRAGEGS